MYDIVWPYFCSCEAGLLCDYWLSSIRFILWCVFYPMPMCSRDTSEMANSMNDSMLSICITVSSNSVIQDTNRTLKHNRNILSTGTDDFFMVNLNPVGSDVLNNMSNKKSVDQFMSFWPSRLSHKVLNFSKNQDQTINSSLLHQPSNNGFTVFHQNIRGSQNKANELLNSLSSNPSHTLPSNQSFSKIWTR